MTEILNKLQVCKRRILMFLSTIKVVENFCCSVSVKMQKICEKLKIKAFGASVRLEGISYSWLVSKNHLLVPGSWSVASSLWYLFFVSYFLACSDWEQEEAARAASDGCFPPTEKRTHDTQHSPSSGGQRGCWASRKATVRFFSLLILSLD